MKIIKKRMGDTIRVPQEMRQALGDNATLVVFGDVVVMTRETFEVESTLKSLRAITRMLELSAELEGEESK